VKLIQNDRNNRLRRICTFAFLYDDEKHVCLALDKRARVCHFHNLRMSVGLGSSHYYEYFYFIGQSLLLGFKKSKTLKNSGLKERSN